LTVNLLKDKVNLAKLDHENVSIMSL
jgi:hypothetical protein